MGASKPAWRVRPGFRPVGGRPAVPPVADDPRVAAAAAGADDCLPKPFDLDHLLGRIEACVAGSRGRAGAGSPAAAVGEASPPTKRPSPRDVRAWFAPGVTGDAFAAQVRALQADPNWRVVYIPGPPTWTLNLVYWPTGEELRLALERDGPLWRWRA